MDNKIYAIKYNRPELFGSSLKEEIVVSKIRTLYMHEDHDEEKVDGLDNCFIEIEVMIYVKDGKDMYPEKSQKIMSDLIKLLNIKKDDYIDIGYREILLLNK